MDDVRKELKDGLEKQRIEFEKQRIEYEKRFKPLEDEYKAKKGLLICGQIIYAMKIKVEECVFSTEVDHSKFHPVDLEQLHSHAQKNERHMKRWNLLGITSDKIAAWKQICKTRVGTAHPNCVHGPVDGICPISKTEECAPLLEDIIDHICNTTLNDDECTAVLEAVGVIKRVNTWYHKNGETRAFVLRNFEQPEEPEELHV